MTTKQAAMEREHTEHYLAYQKIIEEIAADEEALYYDKSAILDEDKNCHYCRINFSNADDVHLKTCIWIRAKALIEKEIPNEQKR